MRNIFLIILAAITALLSSCVNAENGNSTPAPEANILADSEISVSEPYSSETKSKPFSVISEEPPDEPEMSGTASDNSQTSEPPNDKEENALSITVTVNGHAFSTTLYDNETARAFKERLPFTLDMSELNGNEKYYYLPESLPRNSSRPSVINAGDIMLYGDDCVVIFYESFSTSYSYTPIGKIDAPDGLAAAIGSGNAQVVFN